MFHLVRGIGIHRLLEITNALVKVATQLLNLAKLWRIGGVISRQPISGREVIREVVLRVRVSFV